MTTFKDYAPLFGSYHEILTCKFSRINHTAVLDLRIKIAAKKYITKAKYIIFEKDICSSCYKQFI